MKFFFNKTWAINIALFIALFIGLHFWQTRDLAEGQVQLPVAYNLSGEPIDWAQYADQPVLVHFWATWCKVCYFEKDNIESLIEDGYPVINVAVFAESPQQVSQFAQQHQLNLAAIAYDPEGHWLKSWGGVAVPTTFILNSKRQIAFTSVGYTTTLANRLRLWLTT